MRVTSINTIIRIMMAFLIQMINKTSNVAKLLPKATDIAFFVPCKVLLFHLTMTPKTRSNFRLCPRPTNQRTGVVLCQIPFGHSVHSTRVHTKVTVMK